METVVPMCSLLGHLCIGGVPFVSRRVAELSRLLFYLIYCPLLAADVLRIRTVECRENSVRLNCYSFSSVQIIQDFCQ